MPAALVIMMKRTPTMDRIGVLSAERSDSDIVPGALFGTARGIVAGASTLDDVSNTRPDYYMNSEAESTSTSTIRPPRLSVRQHVLHFYPRVIS